jgi:hypothetical protein
MRAFDRQILADGHDGILLWSDIYRGFDDDA